MHLHLYNFMERIHPYEKCASYDPHEQSYLSKILYMHVTFPYNT